MYLMLGSLDPECSLFLYFFSCKGCKNSVSGQLSCFGGISQSWHPLATHATACVCWAAHWRCRSSLFSLPLCQTTWTFVLLLLLLIPSVDFVTRSGGQSCGCDNQLGPCRQRALNLLTSPPQLHTSGSLLDSLLLVHAYSWFVLLGYSSPNILLAACIFCFHGSSAVLLRYRANHKQFSHENPPGLLWCFMLGM